MRGIYRCIFISLNNGILLFDFFLVNVWALPPNARSTILRLGVRLWCNFWRLIIVALVGCLNDAWSDVWWIISVCSRGSWLWNRLFDCVLSPLVGIRIVYWDCLYSWILAFLNFLEFHKDNNYIWIIINSINNLLTNALNMNVNIWINVYQS
jgi:hypothetical protein